MSRVDFYVLSDTAPDAAWRYACRLIEKAVELQNRVFVRVAHSGDAARLDEMLWTFSDRSFLAHEIWSGGEPPHPLVKVLVGEGPAPESHRQVLVNLSGAVPEDFASFERVAEIVDADPERRRQSRDRYKQYRERGCTLETHNL